MRMAELARETSARPGTETAATTITIVGGCGHVGLPLGIALAESGHTTVLLDLDASRVSSVMARRMPFLERGADAALARGLSSKRLRATSDAGAIGEAEVVVVTTGTPVDEFLDPDVRGFDRAMNRILQGTRPGQLLLLRSTLFPGTTDRLGRLIAEQGLGIDLAYCPERIAQGYAFEELGRLPQLVSGTTPQAVRRAAALFSTLGARAIELAPVEAELAKLFANSYRYINFAISNQFYMIAERFGADFARIHEAVTAEYPRMTGFAGAGFAGGPCLLKDTMQLAAFNHNQFALGQAAMMVNEGLPSFIVERLKAGRDLRGATVGILGMAFKGDSDDPRSSLSYKLRKVLTFECRTVLCTDPYIADPDFVGLERVLAESDVLIVGACHEPYRSLRTEKPIVDVFHFVRRDGA